MFFQARLYAAFQLTVMHLPSAAAHTMQPDTALFFKG